MAQAHVWVVNPRISGKSGDFYQSFQIGVGFAPKICQYAETGALAICLDALYQLQQVEVDFKIDESDKSE